MVDGRSVALSVKRTNPLTLPFHPSLLLTIFLLSQMSSIYVNVSLHDLSLLAMTVE